MNLPTDIVARVARDFPTPADRERGLGELTELDVNQRDRIARCVLFSASSDMNQFRDMVALARLDYRDVIVSAEYEYPSGKRVRSFIEPFIT